MPDAAALAKQHWNATPLYVSETERYAIYPWLPEVAEFSKHKGHMVLEIGCGTGCDLLQFAKHGAIATGVDITTNHLKLARKRVGNRATVMEADARRLPFPDATFDYVYSHGVIHHSEEPERIVSEITRVLSPGGRFNIHVYSKWSYVPPLLMLRFGWNWRNHIENSTAPVHINLYTAKRLRELFQVPISITKQQGPMSFWFGWYLIARGQKP